MTFEKYLNFQSFLTPILIKFAHIISIVLAALYLTSSIKDDIIEKDILSFIMHLALTVGFYLATRIILEFIIIVFKIYEKINSTTPSNNKIKINNNHLSEDNSVWNCDKCDKSFELEDNEIEELNEKGRLSVSCPHCKKKNNLVI